MQRRVTRRHALQAVGTALGASVASGSIHAQHAESGTASGGTRASGGASELATPLPSTPIDASARPTVEFDYGGRLDDVSNYDGRTVDARGEDAVKIDVGAEGNGGDFAFEPPAIWVDPGTSVVWNWTGEGGLHSVVADDVFESGVATDDPESTFTYAPEETGVIEYVCVPHEGLGMKGVVAVGVIEQAAGMVDQTATPSEAVSATEAGARKTETPTGSPTVSSDSPSTESATTVRETTANGSTTAGADEGGSSGATGPGFTALTLGAGALGALGLDRLRE